MDPLKNHPAKLNSEIERLERQNAELRADMATIARSVKQTLFGLGIMNEAGEIKADGRSLGKIIPMALNGSLSEKLSFLGDVIPLFDKYKHLAE